MCPLAFKEPPSSSGCCVHLLLFTYSTQNGFLTRTNGNSNYLGYHVLLFKVSITVIYTDREDLDK